MNDLEKMDALKERVDVTYAQAKEALDKFEGDLAKALVYLEEEQGTASKKEKDKADCEFKRSFKKGKNNADQVIHSLIDQIKALIKEGNVTKLRLISEDKVLVEVPATIGAVGLGAALFSPLLLVVTAAGAAAAMVKAMVVEIEKSDGTIERKELKIPSFKGKEQDFSQGYASEEEVVEGEFEEKPEEDI